MLSLSIRSQHVTIAQLEVDLELAGDNHPKLCTLIGAYQLNVPDSYINSAEEAKRLIKQCILSMKTRGRVSKDSMEKRTTALLNTLRKRRQQLIAAEDFFSRTKQELDKLNRLTKCQLNIKFPGFLSELQYRLVSLRNNGVRILLTGEICAGKSSLLNFLMKGKYMPVDHGPCTKIACEVQNSKQREAHLHYGQHERREPTVISDLPTDETDHKWACIRNCIVYGKYPTTPTSDDELPGRLEKVVIYWPLEIFMDHNTEVMTTVPLSNSIMTSSDDASTTKSQDAEKEILPVTFIDVPGIHDTDESCRTLENYIDNADSFLCLVDNSCHHGVDRDRLVKIMTMIRTKSEERYGIFNPDCAIFVCNKWDMVPEDKKEHLQAEIYQKLSEQWPTVSPKQIFPFVGSQEALENVCAGILTDEYEKLYHNMCKFIENSARVTLEANCWWLNTILETAHAMVKNTKNFVSVAKKHAMENIAHLKMLKKEVLELEEKRRRIEQEALAMNTKITNKLKDRIKRCLDNSRQMLSTWKESEIPQRHDGVSWSKFHTELYKRIVERVEDLLLRNNDIESDYQMYVSEVRSQLQNMTDAYQKTESKMILFGPASASCLSESPFSTDIMSNGKLVLLAIGCVIALPLAPFILIVWSIYDEIYLSNYLDNEELFKQDKVEYMKQQTNMFINNVIRDRLSTIAEARLMDVPQNVDHMMKVFKSCIENRLQSIEDFSAAISSKSAITQDSTGIGNLSEELRKFYIAHIMKHDLDENCLSFDMKDQTKLIGKGGCGIVTKGQLVGDSRTTDVAVKVLKWPVGDDSTPENTFIFRECFIMRQLAMQSEISRENFVKFYGSVTQVNGDVYYLCLVTELCNTDLKKLIERETLFLPGTSESEHPPFPGQGRPGDDRNAVDRGKGFVINLGLQAAKGLRFVHENGYVHRDVKPENFLVNFTGDNVVLKITDVGLARAVDRVASVGPTIASFFYKPPEVVKGGIHSKASDIYSLSLVVWEIWYGKLVYRDSSSITPGDLLKMRPEITQTEPPSEMKKLMTASWAANPNDRPEINRVVERLQSLVPQFPWMIIYRRTLRGSPSCEPTQQKKH